MCRFSGGAANQSFSAGHSPDQVWESKRCCGVPNSEEDHTIVRVRKARDCRLSGLRTTKNECVRGAAAGRWPRLMLCGLWCL